MCMIYDADSGAREDLLIANQRIAELERSLKSAKVSA